MLLVVVLEFIHSSIVYIMNDSKYLLKKSSTINKLEESINRVRRLKKKSNDTSTAYNPRLSNSCEVYLKERTLKKSFCEPLRSHIHIPKKKTLLKRRLEMSFGNKNTAEDIINGNSRIKSVIDYLQEANAKGNSDDSFITEETSREDDPQTVKDAGLLLQRWRRVTSASTC